MATGTRSGWTSDGVRLAITDHHPDSEGPHVFMAHATGFCGAVWADVVAGLDGHPITTWDARGHGRSGGGSIPVSWWDFGTDTGVVRDLTPVDHAIGVGHSMGGAAILMAQLSRPSRFRSLVLVEPIVPPPPYLKQEHRLSALARKRRRRFASVVEAEENFRSKPPFDRWRPASLRGYLRDGFVSLEDGSIGLACAPDFEAEVFSASSGTGLFDRLSEITIPVTLLFGDRFDTFPAEFVELLTDSLPRASLVVVQDGDHFLPMTRPETVAAEIREASG